MIREIDWRIGTEWQPYHIADLYDSDFRLSEEIVSWLVNYDGVGRYWYGAIFSQVYFERDEDRMMFAIMFG